jgi:hypothetical protein
MLPDDPRHSTYAGGRVHRGDNEEVCEPCRRAEARYEQARLLDRLNGHPRTLPSLGTMRRIQALVALGHSFTRIAEALGDVTPGAAWALAHRMGPDARATTAAKVASLYEAWSMQLPPAATTNQRKAARYARTIATKHGWPPPLAWDDIDNDPAPAATVEHLDVDPVVVERILAGDAVNATTAERRAVVARWPETGRSYADLARLTGWKVERYHPTATGLEEDAA